MRVIRETVHFFLFSAKRSAVIKTYTEVNLKGVCETRCVERHDAIQISRQLIVPTFKALKDRDKWGLRGVVKSQKYAQ